MGAFLAQALGGVGNDVAGAKQNVKDIAQQDTVNSFTNQLNALKLRQLQLQLSAPPKDDVAAQFAAMEKALGRPLTDAEKQTWLQIAPKATSGASTPFEAWRAQNPSAPIGDWLALNKPATTSTPFEVWRKQNPNSPVSDWLTLSKPPTSVTDKTAFEAWRTQNPNAPIADWLKLQEKFKKPAGGAEDIGGAGLTALARAHAQGEDLPITKQGAALAKQMESMGLKAPNKKEVPADIKAFVAQPPPANPTPEDSQRLAAAADRVFGGTEHRQDLVTRGHQSPWLHLGSSYAPQAYSAGEYKVILGQIKDSVASGGDVGSGPADDEINAIMNAVGKVKR